MDLDLVVQVLPQNILTALQALESLGYQPRIPVTAEQFANSELREKWRRDMGMLVFQLHSDQHRATPADVFVYEPFDFVFEYERAIEEPIAPEINARIIGLEALMKMKLAANRLMDLADLEALQKIAPYKK